MKTNIVFRKYSLDDYQNKNKDKKLKKFSSENKLPILMNNNNYIQNNIEI